MIDNDDRCDLDNPLGDEPVRVIIIDPWGALYIYDLLKEE